MKAIKNKRINIKSENQEHSLNSEQEETSWPKVSQITTPATCGTPAFLSVCDNVCPATPHASQRRRSFCECPTCSSRRELSITLTHGWCPSTEPPHSAWVLEGEGPRKVCLLLLLLSISLFSAFFVCSLLSFVCEFLLFFLVRIYIFRFVSLCFRFFFLRWSIFIFVLFIYAVLEPGILALHSKYYSLHY